MDLQEPPTHLGAVEDEPMNMIPADEYSEHSRCMTWLCLVEHYKVLVDEYLDKAGDMSIQQYIKIMHPEVYVAWRLSQ